MKIAWRQIRDGARASRPIHSAPFALYRYVIYRYSYTYNQ